MKKLLFDLRVKKISFVRSMIICVLFLIVGISAISLMASFADANLTGSEISRITTDTVFINDLEADYNYYMGLNYTKITSDSLPTKNIVYTDNNLVRAFITYSGTDYNTNTLIGKVSPASNEGQSVYKYYKYYPKDSNGYITVELIDNPFSFRPSNTANNKYYGFNGWVTDDDNVVVYLDKETYTRYAKVYVGDQEKVTLNFNASWIPANYRTGTYSQIANLDSYGMKKVPTAEVYGNVFDHIEYIYHLDPSKQYWEQARVNRRQYFTGYAYSNNAGEYVWYNNQYCDTYGGCSYYTLSTRETAAPPTTLYFIEINPQTNKRERTTATYNTTNYYPVEENRIYTSQLLGNKIDLPNNYIALGLYYKTNTIVGDTQWYYDVYGRNCAYDSDATCGGDVYKLIDKTDGDSIKKLVTDYTLPNEIEEDEVDAIMDNFTDPDNYYYLVTRDMNILRVSNQEDFDSSYMTAKPYTITGSAYGETINRRLDIDTGLIVLNGDMVIENININNSTSATVSETPFSLSNGSISSKVLIANRHNLKVGRNVKPYTNGRFTFYGIAGTYVADNDFSEFKVIVESGVYDFLLSNGTGTTTSGGFFGGTSLSTIDNTMHGTFIYGSDYDRMDNRENRTPNLNLIITFCAYASNAGGLYGENTYTPSSTMIIKSGSYGKGAAGTTYDGDYSHGVYVGSRGTANTWDSSLRELIFEGGDINVINGGPLVNSANYDKNVVALYMKGGKVRSIFGGAGQSATGGNRIIAVTGGEVTNNVFGGSNSYNGGTQDGYLEGDTLVYIGGNAEIGTADNILFNVNGQTSPGVGDVFGAGNGRNGNNYVNVGTVDNSHIIINGGQINGSVYGGGNFGSVGLKVSTSATTVDLLGGSVDGSVYGAGNNAGGGSDYGDVIGETLYTGYGTFDSRSTRSGYNPAGVYSNTLTCNGSYPGATMGGNGRWYCQYATTRIDPGSPRVQGTTYYRANGTSFQQTNNPATAMDVAHPPINITVNYDGTSVGEAIYGGSNTSGTVKGHTNVNLISSAAPTPSVYGGGKGSATTIQGNTNVTATPSSNASLVINEVYGGSAFGNVNSGGAFTTNVTINGGTFTNVFGGSEGDEDTAPTNAGDITVNINGGTITAVYGANNKNGVPDGSIDVHLAGGNITYAYGGGNEAAIDTATVYLEGSTVAQSVFGGSNKSGTNNTTIVHVNSGSANNIFGGNNEGGSVDSTYVYYDGATVSTATYGCGYGSNTSCTNTNVVVNGATGPAVYGGGYASSVTNSANVLMASGAVTNLFGGSNTAGAVNETNVYISGGTTTNAYGGNNSGGTNPTTNVFVGGGTNTNVYGGGFQVAVDETNVKVSGGVNGNVFGGGNEAGINTETKVDVVGGTVNQVFGGSNTSGNVPITTVNISADGTTEAYDTEQSYTANNVAYTPGTDGVVAYPTYTAQMMRVNNVYGGNNEGGKSATTNVNVDGGYTNNVYGGSQGVGAQADTTKVTVTGGNTGNVYGGGDNAVVNGDTDVVINGGNVTNLYGGGNGTPATVKGNTSVAVNGGTSDGNVFGGGNNAVVNGNTDVIINNGTVHNLFGGGNGAPATVKGSAYVIVNGGLADNNVFGGGNNAVTEHNTTVSVIAGKVEGSLFGAGNNAATGTENNNNSVSTVNILGGEIVKNVYGGANFSKVYGSTDINIGDKTVSDEKLEDFTYAKTIKIGQTVFGGGEAKSENDDEYDWTYISVTQGLEIVIDGEGYDMEIGGSVFGSGNASSSAGISNVIIKNFGTDSDVKTIESIQRATNVMIINSSLQLLGAADSTNAYNDDFTINRVDNFYLIDNSSLYLLTGANVLKNFYSGYYDQNDDFQKEEVEIDNGDDINNPNGGDLDRTSMKVNNRLFMSPNKNLNILTEEQVQPRYAGNVNGMCFLGIYIPNDDGKTMSTGIYNTSFENGDSVDHATAEKMRYSGTYVYGKHKTDHDITVDGFWSYYLNKAGDAVHINYVDTTPKGSMHYIWAIGVQTVTYEIELAATRYSTLGVKNLALSGFENPNTVIEVKQFQYQNLNQGVTIVDKSQVKKVADTSEIANNKFGLEMGTTDTGWMSPELTRFFSNSTGFLNTNGDFYETESTAETPMLSFYLYNSKNIELDVDEDKRSLGYASVIMTAQTPDPENPLSFILTSIEVKVKISLQQYNEDGYSSVIAPGKKYSVFPYDAANIANNGSVSIYHNLFLDLTGVDKNGDPWSAQRLYPTGAYRAIASDYVYPIGTTVTMIDLTNNQYYYYTVDAQNIVAKQQEMATSGEVSYYLRDFIKMDSTSPGNHYDDAASNARYLNTQQQNAFEEFIFTVDFSNANVTENVTSRLYLELRDPNNNDAPIISPLPFQGDRMKFKIFQNANTQLITTGTLSSNTVYVGDSVLLNLNTEYRQAEDSVEGTIYDTTYDEFQLGSAITFYDAQGNKLDGSSLLGVVITVNDTPYYAQMDGTYRVKLAGKIANVDSTMIINTASSNLTSGQYTMKIETFGSYDGLYSGEIKNEPLYLSLNVLNNKFGLLVESDDVAITHDKNDGTDANGSKKIDFTITTSSGQANPNLRVRLERREYRDVTTPGDLDYQFRDVDINDVFVDQLDVADAEKKLYYVTHDLPENIDFSLTLRDDVTLRTGTYRIVFGVYDGDNYIGSVYRYLIIREMK